MPTTNERLTREITAQAEQFDELWEAPLEVTTRTQLVVVLCTGGPHVEAVADLDSDCAVVSASIVGYWGSETVRHPVKPGSSLWRALRDPLLKGLRTTSQAGE